MLSWHAKKIIIFSNMLDQVTYTNKPYKNCSHLKIVKKNTVRLVFLERKLEHAIQFLKQDIKRSLILFTLIYKFSPVVSRRDFKYFISFIDPITRYHWIYMLTFKEQTFEVFKHFFNYTSKQYNVKIKILKTDNGREYES